MYTIAAFALENPLEWEFRLVGGLTPLSGRVEMRPNSTAPWGTICNNLFQSSNFGPIAACNSAGLVGVTQALYKSTFGPGTGPIYLTNVACTASTTFIQNCSRSPLLQTGACVHFEDVGVECSPPTALWQFKMVNGTAPSNGIVLMQPMPSLPWGLVYNFPFNYGSWRINREVMCRTLGYNTTSAIALDARTLATSIDSTRVPPYFYLSSCPASNTAHIGLCSYQPVGSQTFSWIWALALDCDPPPRRLIGPVTVRLINGATATSGVIWISPNASAPWFGITAEDVTDNTGTTSLVQALTPAQRSLLRAVCTAAGFPNATNPIFGKYGSSSGPPGDSQGFPRLIGMDFNCSNSSGTSLGDCTVGPDVRAGYSLSTAYYAGVDCFPTALNFSYWEFRLTGGTATMGRVELRPNNTAPWLGICASYSTFDNGFASRGVLWTALCRTMGFNTNYGMRSRATIPGLTSSIYYLGMSTSPYCPTVSNNGFTLLPNATLQACSLSPIGMHGCSSAGEDLRLDCDFPDALQAEMRLVGGPKPTAGRLEMRPNASFAWGTIADPLSANMNFNWQVYNALTLCRSLGYTNVSNPTLTMAFGPGNASQPIWWSNMQCASMDSNFRNCSAESPFGNSLNYGHSYDMGVDCYPPPFEPIVLLEQGGAPWKGRVMLRFSQFIAIGSVCNDMFRHNHFAWNAACRSAGFINITNARYQNFGPASSSSIPISLDDVNCAPTDRFLQNCSHRPYGQHDCNHGQDAGVDCYPPPEDTSVWQFRLADGTASTNGRLEMRPNAAYGWGSICAGPYFNHTVAAWEAACRQVGIMNPPRARWRYFPKGSDTVFLDNVSCNANDLFLVPNCTMFPRDSYRCTPTEVAGLDCAAPPEAPSQWEFRLTGGRSSSSGRLEMRPDSVTPWGAVCRRGLTTLLSLRVVCRSAGYNIATRPVVYLPLEPPPSTLPFYLDKAMCNASTLYLHNCSYAPLYSHDCSMDLGDALYVECYPTATSSLSLNPPRTQSGLITPTGGWPTRARTASPTNAANTVVSVSPTRAPNATSTTLFISTSRPRTRTDTSVWPPRSRTLPLAKAVPSQTTTYDTNTAVTRSAAARASSAQHLDHARTASRTPTLPAPCGGVCVLRAVGTGPEDAARVEHANATQAAAWMLPPVAGGANATSFGSPSDANCTAAKVGVPFAVHRDGWVVVALVVTSEHLRPAPLSVAALSANPSWAVVETRMAVGPRLVLVSLERMGPAVLRAEEVVVTVKGAVTCPSGAVGPAVELRLAFAGAPNPLQQAVETLRDVAGAVASVGAVANPWGLVVAGTVTSVLAMGRCEAPEPTDDVDFLQSPLGLSAGPVEGGSYRGALAGIPLVVLAAKVVVCAVAFLRGWLTDTDGTWRGRARAGALAARAEAVVGMAAGAAFAGGVCAYCGIVLATTAPNGPGDVFLGTVSLLAAAGAVGHVGFVLWRCPLIECQAPVRGLRTASNGRLRAAAAWLVTPQTAWGPTGADKSDTGGVGSGAMHDWEHRYRDYLGEARRWRQFLTAQMAIDGITSFLEGLPLDDRDHCKVRLGVALVVMFIAAVAITALRPLSIPLELGCAIAVQWLLVAVTAVMLANEWAVSPAAESASQSLGVAAMVVNILPMLCIVVPQAVRALLELRRKARRGADTDTPNTKNALDRPMLEISDDDANSSTGNASRRPSRNTRSNSSSASSDSSILSLGAMMAPVCGSPTASNPASQDLRTNTMRDPDTTSTSTGNGSVRDNCDLELSIPCLPPPTMPAPRPPTPPPPREENPPPTRRRRATCIILGPPPEDAPPPPPAASAASRNMAMEDTQADKVARVKADLEDFCSRQRSNTEIGSLP